MCTGSGRAPAYATSGSDQDERSATTMRSNGTCARSAGADGVGVPCEEAEDDLVRAHEQRTEVAHGPPLLDECVGGSSSALVERARAPPPPPRPEALGHVLHAAACP